jgi:type IV pilus assembly protein PilC
MTEYQVRVGTPEGAVLEQRHRAVSAEALRRDLENKGLAVFRVEERRGALRLPLLRRREKLAPLEFLTFNQQFATLLKAGMPVLQSLELLQRAQSGAVFKDVLGRVLDDVRGGSSLSDAFAAQGGLFPPLYCATIFAGERAGELVPVLNRYVRHQRMLDGVRRKVTSALTYPMVLVALSLGLVVLLMTYVIPRFATFFLGFSAELPLETRIVIGTAKFIQDHLPWEIGFLVAAFIVLRRWIHTESGAVAIDRLKLRIPFVGRVYHLLGLSQFIRSLGTLIAGGTPLVTALEIAGAVVTNRAISVPLALVAPSVREGQPLWSSLETTRLFPELSLAMVQVGEATGALEDMLFNVSELYDETIEVRLARIVTLIEPAVLVVMGCVVAGLLMSIYLPMFTLFSKIQ